MSAGQFEFGLYDDLGNLLQTATNEADGSVTFDPIAYNESDASKSFTYYIYEQAGQTPGMTYDTAEHTAVVTVTDNGDGTLNCDVTYDGDTEPSTFQNTYSVGALDVTKTVVGRNPDPNAEFGFKVTFTDPDGEETIEEFTLHNGQTKHFADIVAGTTYVVEETDMPFGYVQNGIEDATGTIEDGNTSSSIVSNRYNETTSIDMMKRWERDDPEDRPSSISVQLLADGNPVETVEVTAEEEWTHRFENLPVYATDGETPIVYTVREVEVPEGYEVSYDGYTIINTAHPKIFNLPVSGVWAGVLTPMLALVFVAAALIIYPRRKKKHDGEDDEVGSEEEQG